MARKTQPLDIAKHPVQQDSSANHTQEPADNLVMKGKISTPEVQPSAQEEQHRAAEHEYWRRELRMMLWLNWITAIAVVGGIISLLYIKRTLDATWIAANAARIQAETARAQLEEMKSSSADTRAVADAAKAQSASAEKLAEAAKTQAMNTEKLAVTAQENMQATRESLEVSRQALQTAREQAKVSEKALILPNRPWITINVEFFPAFVAEKIIRALLQSEWVNCT